MAQRRQRPRARSLTDPHGHPPERPARPNGWLAPLLHGYLHDEPLRFATALTTLTRAFLAAFTIHLGVITLVTLAAALLAGRQDAPNPLLTWVLLIAAYGNLFLAILIANVGQSAARRSAVTTTNPDAVREEDSKAQRDRRHALRRSALAQTLFTTVLLTTPGWFLAFAWLTGQPLGTLLALILGLTLGYAFGLLQVRPLARALSQSREVPTPTG